jgi:Sec-independent protein secretion pathway component TatC
MSFWFVVSFALLVLAIIGVFIELPIVSQYAFWLAVVAYALLGGASFHHYHRR